MQYRLRILYLECYWVDFFRLCLSSKFTLFFFVLTAFVIIAS